VKIGGIALSIQPIRALLNSEAWQTLRPTQDHDRFASNAASIQSPSVYGRVIDGPKMLSVVASVAIIRFPDVASFGLSNRFDELFCSFS